MDECKPLNTGAIPVPFTILPKPHNPDKSQSQFTVRLKGASAAAAAGEAAGTYTRPLLSSQLEPCLSQ